MGQWVMSAQWTVGDWGETVSFVRRLHRYWWQPERGNMSDWFEWLCLIAGIYLELL